MKRYLLVVICLVCALFVAGPASAATLGLDYLIGTVVPGHPSDPGDEFVYTQNLISFWNNTANDPSNYDAGPPPTGNDYFLAVLPQGSSVPASLPDVTGTGVQSLSVVGLDLTGYDYLYAKFGDDGALYWLGGLFTSIDGFNPAWGPFTEQGGGLSHVTLFGPGTTRVPEAGALIMFGTGLIGLIGYRRMRRMQ